MKGRCPRPLDDGGEAVFGLLPDHEKKLRVWRTLRQDTCCSLISLTLILSLPDRDREEEAGSLAGGGDHPDLAAMHFNDASAHGEPNAEP